MAKETDKKKHTPSNITNALYELVKNSKVTDAVYKVMRPAQVDTKVRSFAVVEVATRLRDNADNGGGIGDTISRVTIFVRSGAAKAYPATAMEEKEKMVSDLFPFNKDGIWFGIQSILPPMYDDVGFYGLIVQLNTTIV